MSRLFRLLPAFALLLGSVAVYAQEDAAKKDKKPAAKEEKPLSEADKALQEKGVKWKAGKFHLEEKEKTMDEAYKAYLTKIKPKYNTADKAIQKIEKELAKYHKERDDVRSKLEAIDKSLEGILGNTKRDELTKMRAQFGDYDSKLERDMSVLHQKMAGERDKFNGLLVERLSELQKLRKDYDKIAAAYRKLDKDDDLKKAVEKVQAEDAKRKGKIGPTEAFTQLDLRIKKEENTLIPDVIPLKQTEGGSGWYLNIGFGGDNSALKEFHLDTGADGVTMSWALATELGLKPEKSTDRRIGILASGQQASGVQVIAPLVRVGRFEVKDVEVFVFDQRYPDASSLFGIEVMNGFRWYIDPENKTLTIVEREGAPERKPAKKPEPKKEPEKKG